MRDGIAFLLHQQAEEAYAAALANALSPRAAFPVCETMGRQFTFGSGAICVILWTPEWAAAGSAALVTNLTANGGSKAIVVCLRGVEAAPEFIAAQHMIVRANGEVAADTAPICAALDVLAAEGESDGKRGAYRARLGTSGANAVSGRNLSRKFAARSAVGLAATFGVVFMASEYFAGRATAGLHNSEPAPSTDTESIALAPAATVETHRDSISTITATTHLRIAEARGVVGPDGSFAPSQQPTGREPAAIAIHASSIAPLDPIHMVLTPLDPPTGLAEVALIGDFPSVVTDMDNEALSPPVPSKARIKGDAG